MLRMIQSDSSSHAKAYFSGALSKSDYYINDQELQGTLKGKLAERLGLPVMADKETFYALTENINPGTGKPLTPRTKEERMVGYDCNYHAPKSVSVLNFLSKNNHILEAFQASVHETMQDIEADAMTRVRKDNRKEDRHTGELVWAEFVHQTARPVKNHLPDPHLHSHCFVFNTTWDETEKRYKAAKFRDIKRDMPYYQARFHKRLADKLQALGYEIRQTNSSFEVVGVPQKVIDLFSKRTNEIGQVAKEQGITAPDQLADLGARTRSAKQKGLSMAELKADWKRQIREISQEGDADGVQPVRYAPKPEKEQTGPTAQHCVNYSLSHCLERASVVADRRLLRSAYRYGLGNSSVTLDDITSCFKKDQRIIHIEQGSKTLCTTQQVLAEEKRMVELARQGKGKFLPLYREAPDIKLDGEQRDAIEHILTSTSQVSIVRGSAGTGKTTLMKEAVQHINQAGKQVFVVAPTAEASRGVLKEEGFINAETVAALLSNKLRHQELKDQVLWVDEAGLLGTKDMTDLLELATQQNARLILGGDTRQHTSVTRGDSLRILNTVGGIRAAEVTKIHRQKSEQYKSAVEDLSKGEVQQAFDKLDAMESIIEIDPLKPNEQLVNDYIEAVKKNKSALVISPTHKQGEETTAAIRQQLKVEGLLGKKEILVKQLVSSNMTEAEKGDWRNFRQGQIVQFNLHAKGIRRGSAWKIHDVQQGKIELQNDEGKTALLPLAKAKAFDVFHQQEMGLSKGDKVRITRNGSDAKDKRLNNGQALEVVSISETGKVKLISPHTKTRYELSQEFGHLAHAHCITSHASQGKSTDEVFVVQPSGTFGATDARQFYVSVSRGKERARIYTDDKAMLLEHASDLNDRQSALELVNKANMHQVHLELQNRQPLPSKENTPQTTKDKKVHNYVTDLDYEPGI